MDDCVNGRSALMNGRHGCINGRKVLGKIVNITYFFLKNQESANPKPWDLYALKRLPAYTCTDASRMTLALKCLFVVHFSVALVVHFSVAFYICDKMLFMRNTNQ